MKTLNSFINEQLNSEVNESIFSKIEDFYQRKLRSRIKVEDYIDMAKGYLNRTPGLKNNYFVEIKKASDVINDKNCATLNIGEIELRHVGSKERYGDLYSGIGWSEFLGEKDDFEDFYKHNPNVDVVCIVDNTSSKHIYSILDWHQFNLSKKGRSKWHHTSWNFMVITAIDTAIKEIGIFKSPVNLKDTRYMEIEDVD